MTDGVMPTSSVPVAIRRAMKSAFDDARALGADADRAQELADTVLRAYLHGRTDADSAAVRRRMHKRRQFVAICRTFDWRCAYCSRPDFEHLNTRASLTRDHVVPRSAGGSLGKMGSNIVPACLDCQHAKAARELWADFVPSAPHPELVRRFPRPASARGYPGSVHMESAP
jgi:hypothetical protein